jgi:hypothetical protein
MSRDSTTRSAVFCPVMYAPCTVPVYKEVVASPAKNKQFKTGLLNKSNRLGGWPVGTYVYDPFANEFECHFELIFVFIIKFLRSESNSLQLKF